MVIGKVQVAKTQRIPMRSQLADEASVGWIFQNPGYKDTGNREEPMTAFA
jgi:hypothetical protein